MHNLYSLVFSVLKSNYMSIYLQLFSWVSNIRNVIYLTIIAQRKWVEAELYLSKEMTQDGINSNPQEKNAQNYIWFFNKSKYNKL